jgi:hypothetical protein
MDLECKMGQEKSIREIGRMISQKGMELLNI